MREHRKYSPYELMSCSDDSPSVGQSVVSSFKETSLKGGIDTNDINGHEVDDPSEVSVAPLGEPAFPLELARLVDGGVQARKGDKTPVGVEVVDISYLGKERGPCGGVDAADGSDNLEVFNSSGLTELSESLCDPVESFHKVKERGYLPGQYELLGRAYGCDGALGCLDKLLWGDRGSSSAASAAEGLGDVLGPGNADYVGRGEFLKKVEHGLGEDVAHALQFRESALEKPFDLVLRGGTEAGEGFPLPGDVPEVLEILGDVNLGDGVLMDKKEPGDGQGVLLVGLGLSEGELGEVGNKQRVENHCFGPFGSHEGEEIDVVAAGGLHSDKGRGKLLAIRGDGLEEFGEALGVHVGRHGEARIAFGVKPRGGKGILGDINTNEKTIQSSTSLRCCLDKAGEASRPILHDDEGSLTQSTYRLWEAGNRLLRGFKDPGDMEFSCLSISCMFGQSPSIR